MKTTKTNIKKQAKPQGDEKQRNLRRAEYIFLFIALALVIWYIFFIPHDTSPQNNSPAPQAWKRLSADETECDALVCVKVDDAKYDSQYGYGDIYGRAVNYTGKDLSFISVNFGIYNGDTKTGSCIANETHLANGTTWSFKAVCSGTSGSSYKVEDVTYY